MADDDDYIDTYNATDERLADLLDFLNEEKERQRKIKLEEERKQRELAKLAKEQKKQEKIKRTSDGVDLTINPVLLDRQSSRDHQRTHQPGRSPGIGGAAAGNTTPSGGGTTGFLRDSAHSNDGARIHKSSNSPAAAAPAADPDANAKDQTSKRAPPSPVVEKVVHVDGGLMVNIRTNPIFEKLQPDDMLTLDLSCINLVYPFPKGYDGIFLVVRDKEADGRPELDRTEVVVGEADPKFTSKFTIAGRYAGLEANKALDIEAYLQPSDSDKDVPSYYGTASFKMTDIALSPGQHLQVDLFHKKDPDRSYLGSLVAYLDFAREEINVYFDMKVSFAGAPRKKSFIAVDRFLRQGAYGRVYFAEATSKISSKKVFDLKGLSFIEVTAGNDQRPFRISLYEEGKEGTRALLGYTETSLASLRRQAPGSEIFWWYTEEKPVKAVTVVSRNLGSAQEDFLIYPDGHFGFELEVQLEKDLTEMSRELSRNRSYGERKGSSNVGTMLDSLTRGLSSDKLGRQLSSGSSSTSRQNSVRNSLRSLASLIKGQAL